MILINNIYNTVRAYRLTTVVHIILHSYAMALSQSKYTKYWGSTFRLRRVASGFMQSKNFLPKPGIITIVKELTKIGSPMKRIV